MWISRAMHQTSNPAVSGQATPLPEAELPEAARGADYLRFRSLRSSGRCQEQASSPSSSAGSRIVVAVVAWADVIAPAACSVQLESVSSNTYGANKQEICM